MHHWFCIVCAERTCDTIQHDSISYVNVRSKADRQPVTEREMMNWDVWNGQSLRKRDQNLVDEIIVGLFQRLLVRAPGL